MLEIPEGKTLAEQLNQTVKGKVIRNVTAGHSPHKFAWYFGDPSAYQQLLSGLQIDGASAVAGNVEIHADDRRILLQESLLVRFYRECEPLPEKHQLLIEFEDGSALTATVQMYGGLCAFREGENENPYYLVAKEKPSPLSDDFSETYFSSLLSGDKTGKLSAKAFLATEQRIPGLGNGVLQDILWNARIHPKRKMNTLSDTELSVLFSSVKSTLFEMTLKGGRDTERDLFGCLGGYVTVLSKNTVGKPCPLCGSPILKQAYLGGSVYTCEHCQKL